MLQGYEDEEHEEDGGEYETQAEDSGERGDLTSAAPEGVRTARGGLGALFLLPLRRMCCFLVDVDIKDGVFWAMIWMKKFDHPGTSGAVNN